MRTDKKIISEMERLFKEYDEEVEKRRKEGILKNTTARTYLLHAENFVRWCKEEFIPGITKLRNSNKNQRPEGMASQLRKRRLTRFVASIG